MRYSSNDREGDETIATRLIHHTVIPIKLNPHGLLRGLIRSDWCQYTCNHLDIRLALDFYVMDQKIVQNDNFEQRTMALKNVTYYSLSSFFAFGMGKIIKSHAAATSDCDRPDAFIACCSIRVIIEIDSIDLSPIYLALK